VSEEGKCRCCCSCCVADDGGDGDDGDGDDGDGKNRQTQQGRSENMTNNTNTTMRTAGNDRRSWCPLSFLARDTNILVVGGVRPRCFPFPSTGEGTLQDNISCRVESAMRQTN